jgi:PAS domain S-box-containing protein
MGGLPVKLIANPVSIRESSLPITGMAHISLKFFRGIFPRATAASTSILCLLPTGIARAQDGGVGAPAPGYGILSADNPETDGFLFAVSPGTVFVGIILALLAASLIYTALSARSLSKVLAKSGQAHVPIDPPGGQRQAQASRGQFEDFIDHGPSPVAILDPSLVFISVNPRWLEVMQTDRRKIIGRGVGEVLPWILTGNLLDTCRTVLRANRSANLGRTEIALANTTLLFNVTATAITDRLVLTLTDLSEIKIAQQALDKAEQNQAAILGAVPDLMVRVDRHGLILGCHAPVGNGALRAGTPVVGRHLSEVLPPDLVTLAMAEVEKALVTGEAQYLKHSADLPSGTRHYEARVVASGEDEAVAIIRNITDQKRAEQTLIESQERLGAMERFSPVGLFQTDANAQATYANERWAEMAGMSAKDALGNGWMAALHQDDLSGVAKAWEIAAATGGDVNVEHRLVHPNGDVVHVIVRATPKQDADGNPDGYVGVVIDVTETTEALRAVETTEESLAGILQHAGEAIISIGEDQRIRIFNHFAERMFGYSAQEALGMPLVELLPQHLRSIHQGRVGEFIRSGDEARPMETRSQITAQRKDGTIFPAEATISQTQRGRERIATVIMRDVAERVESDAELRAAIERAEYASRAKTEFLANTSHELRTPLNAIIGFSEMLQAGIPQKLTEKQSEYAADIHKSGLHLLSILSDILDVSKIESDATELYEEDVEIADEVKLCLRMVSERAVVAGVGLSANIPDGLPKIRADSRMIRQIMINLMSNAVKFTPEGGSAKISAKVAPNGGVMIDVVDTGIGMRPSDIPKALEKFGQIDGALDRRYEGTGLGLPLAKAQIELHGGTLKIISQLQFGTTVQVRFPPHRTLAPATV